MIKGIERKNSGITLIALIITIIIMIILAGVSINAVVGDNGILTNAIEASRLADITDIKEQIQIALLNKLDDNGDYTYVDVLEVAKEITGNEVDTENKTVETAKGNKVDLTDILEGAVISWFYDDDGNVTNGSVTLAIGDTVYYNAVTNATTTSYTSPSGSNGYSDQTFTLTDDDDYEWQVMGVDEETGELLIVLSYNSSTGYNYLKTDASSYYYLKGQTGYVNCVDELDNICGLFGQGYGATGARSITVEDVNKLTGYDPETALYESGYVYEYGNEVTYTKNSSTGYIDYQGTKYPTSLTTQRSFSSFTYYSEDNKEWIKLGSGESATLKSTYYYYTKSNYSTNSSVVFPSSGYYWLASPCVFCDSGCASFSCRCVSTSGVSFSSLSNSSGYALSNAFGVRPAVSLESDVSLSGISTDGWTIN